MIEKQCTLRNVVDIADVLANKKAAGELGHPFKVVAVAGQEYVGADFSIFSDPETPVSTDASWFRVKTLKKNTALIEVRFEKGINELDAFIDRRGHLSLAENN